MLSGIQSHKMKQNSYQLLEVWWFFGGFLFVFFLLCLSVIVCQSKQYLINRMMKATAYILQHMLSALSDLAWGDRFHPCAMWGCDKLLLSTLRIICLMMLTNTMDFRYPRLEYFIGFTCCAAYSKLPPDIPNQARASSSWDSNNKI